MPDEFKHITVTPEAEEDVVIYAGLGAAHSETAAAETKGISFDGAVAEVFDAATDIHDAAKDAAPDAPAASANAATESAAADERGVPGSASVGTKGVPDTYDDDLTLDDLKSPMPLKQRFVIIAVVSCLIGAIVYCLAFMR